MHSGNVAARLPINASLFGESDDSEEDDRKPSANPFADADSASRDMGGSTRPVSPDVPPLLRRLNLRTPAQAKREHQLVPLAADALQQERLTNDDRLSGVPPWTDIEENFRDEPSMRKFSLQECILVPLTNCPQCNHMLGSCDSNGILRCHNCKQTTGKEWKQSLHKGTFFESFRGEGKKGGKHELMRFVCDWLCGADVGFQRKSLGWSNGKVADWSRNLQEAIALSALNDTEPIGGDDIVVETDESKFGERKHHRGHRAEGAWVFGGVENAPARRFFAVIVEKRDKATLMPLTRKFIAPGSIVISDEWKAHNKIKDQVGFDYTHETVCHEREFVNSETGACTDTTEGTWAGVKCNTPQRKRNKKELQNCLFEFMWRRNNEGNLWNALLRALAETKCD